MVAKRNVSGGTQAGAAIVRGPFSFAYTTANLNDGVAFYTPTVGDILHEVWFEVDTAFDGTTPKADVGTYVGTNAGFLKKESIFIDLSYADEEVFGEGILTGTSTNIKNVLISQMNTPTDRVFPAKFTATNPLKVVVSQDGLKGGTAVGGTAGAAKIYLITSTPVAL